MAFARISSPMVKSVIQLTGTESEGGRMLIKAQIQFAQHQIEQLDSLRRQTGATRTELVRRVVDYCIRGIQEHGVQKALLPLPTGDTRKAR